MPSTFVESGETNISAIAARVFNGDWERFTEIYDLNPDLDVFDSPTPQAQIAVPEIEQILSVAQPALSSVRSAIAGIAPESSLLKTVSQIEGYAKQAIELVGEINGAAAKVQSVIVAGQKTGDRNYGDKLVQLVPWLLGDR